MSPTVNTHELLAHIAELVATETAAIVKTEDGAERRRGRIDAYDAIAKHVRGPDPVPAKLQADYGFGSATPAY